MAQEQATSAPEGAINTASLPNASTAVDSAVTLLQRRTSRRNLLKAATALPVAAALNTLLPKIASADGGDQGLELPTPEPTQTPEEKAARDAIREAGKVPMDRIFSVSDGLRWQVYNNDAVVEEPLFWFNTATGDFNFQPIGSAPPDVNTNLQVHIADKNDFMEFPPHKGNIRVPYKGVREDAEVGQEKAFESEISGIIVARETKPLKLPDGSIYDGDYVYVLIHSPYKTRIVPINVGWNNPNDPNPDTAMSHYHFDVIEGGDNVMSVSEMESNPPLVERAAALGIIDEAAGNSVVTVRLGTRFWRDQLTSGNYPDWLWGKGVKSRTATKNENVVRSVADFELEGLQQDGGNWSFQTFGANGFQPAEISQVYNPRERGIQVPRMPNWRLVNDNPIITTDLLINEIPQGFIKNIRRTNSSIFGLPREVADLKSK